MAGAGFGVAMGNTVHSSLGLPKALENLGRGKAQQTENIPSHLPSV